MRVEQVVLRVAGEDVGEAGLDADPAERQLALALPLLRRRELDVAEHHAGLLERLLRVALRERHRHVEVGRPGLLRGEEDRLVEARVAGVEDGVGSAVAHQRDERGLVGGVDLGGAEAVRLLELRSTTALRARQVDVRERHVVEEAAPLRDRGDGCADPARSDDENSHVVRP